MSNADVVNQPWDSQQPPMTTPRARKSGLTAFLWGSICGGILAIFYLANVFILEPNLLRFASLEHLDKGEVTNGVILAYFSFFSILSFLLGIIASRLTSKVSTGVLACIWVTFWVGLANLLFFVCNFLLFYILHPARTTSDDRSFIYLILSLIPTVLIYLILGVVFGAVGGLIGRAFAFARANKQPTPPAS